MTKRFYSKLERFRVVILWHRAQTMPKILISILIIGGILSGCSSMTTDDTIEANVEITQTLSRFSREYVLVAGDRLAIVVHRDDAISREVTVRGDGRISLPLLDEIHVSGMTVTELDTHLTELLSKRLVDPDVTVIVQNPQEPMVYVLGEVNRVQPIALRSARTAAQAIAQAGDMKKSARRNKVSVVRLDDQGHLMAITIDGEASGQPGFYMALQNMPLQADDLVIVPESIRYQFIRQLNDSLGAINQILNPYFQYRILEEITRQNDFLDLP